MSAIEQEIIDRIALLDRPAKQRVLELLERDLQSEPSMPSEESEKSFDMLDWLARLDEIRAEVDANPANNHAISVLDLLDELRDEEP